MNPVPYDFAEAVLAAMLVIWPDFLDEQIITQCPRCSEQFKYRKRKGSAGQPKFCINCAKY
jgi:hypothetical protein